MRPALALLLAVVTTAGCRVPAEFEPYPKDRDVVVSANAQRPFTVRRDVADECRAIRVLGTVRRSTLDTLWLSPVKEVDAAAVGDARCRGIGEATIVLTSAERRPYVTQVGREAQRRGLVVVGLVVLAIVHFATTVRTGG